MSLAGKASRMHTVLRFAEFVLPGLSLADIISLTVGEVTLGNELNVEGWVNRGELL